MMKMKYIVTADADGLEEIFLFSPMINHDAMAEAVFCVKNHTRDPWHRVHRQVVSAGFVISDGTCHGRSESLGLSARPEDTRVLAVFLKENQL